MADVQTSQTSLPLVPGWNLVSLPRLLPNGDPAVALEAIAGQLVTASTYHTCDLVDPVKKYIPSAPDASDLDAIEHRMGLWLNMSVPSTLPVTGSQVSETNIPLCPGWNLVGYPLPERAVADALSSIAGKFSRVYGYDPTDAADPWAVYDPAVPEWANDLQTLRPGGGYWVLASEQTILTLSNAPRPPTITIVVPADGAEVTAPVPVQATAAPPTGQAITTWTLSYRRIFRGASPSGAVTLATGSGALPAILATFDPTRLANGTYAISLTAEASGGGSATATSTVIVSHALKIGRFQATYQDLDVPVDGFRLQVLRTYDSYDKNVGDFGVGWRLDLSNFRVASNRTLGAGGWQRITVPCGFLVCTDVENSTARFVTVVHPDGRTEVFDFDPQPGSALFSSVTAAFKARPGTGTTSRLEVVGNPTLLWTQEGNLSTDIFTGEIFDPQQFTLTLLDGRVLLLDRTSGLLSATDRNGNWIQVTGGGVLSSSGRSITFARDSVGRIRQITGPNGEVVRYEYSSAGDLDASIDANGNRLGYTYDASHLLLTTSGPGGQPIQTLHYDAEGRLTGVTDAHGNTTEISNDVPGRKQIVTDRLRRLTTIYSFDDRGNAIRQEDLFDGISVASDATYDTAGRLLTGTDALGNTTRITYDAAGNPTEFRDPLGNITKYTYDATGRLLTQTAPDGTIVARLTYDARGNLTRQEQADGTAISYTYDAAGRQKSRTDARGHTVRFDYDAAGRLSTLTDAAGAVSRVTIDASGRATSVTDALGAVTTFGYDPNGNLTRITGPTGHSRSFTYDWRGNVTAMTDALGQTTVLEYDAAGLLVRVTDRNGALTAYAYDAEGRLIRKELPGANVTTLTYDGAGRLVSLADATTVLEYTHDAIGQVLSETTRGTAAAPRPAVTVAYTYDARGARLSMTSPAGTTTYTHDEHARMTSLRTPSGGVYRFGYDTLSRLTSHSRPSGVVDALAYDTAGNLLSRTARHGAATLTQATYTYDAVGRRTSLADGAGAHAFTYDVASQLTAATHPAGSGFDAESYVYDLAGNRTASALSSFYTYDDGDRLVADARFTYQYDNEGNQVRRTETATGAATIYEWDAEHRLLAIHFPDGTNTKYRYDPLGRRSEINAAGTIVRYVYDGSDIHLEYDGTNALVASYAGGLSIDDVLAVTQDGQTYDYLKDALGSTVALADNTGTAVARYAYDAFGRQVASGSIPNPFTYTGREYDAKSGLYYYRHRYYDPATGRFLSEDPEPVHNPYPYASNCPVNLTDPNGLSATTEYRTTVYVARKKSGECYFGITKQALKARWNQHKRNMMSFIPDPITKGLSPLATFANQSGRRQARQIEGMLIDFFGGPGGQLANAAGSGGSMPPIDPTRAWSIIEGFLDIVVATCGPGLK
jgi:RHS repeat-associated protein